MVGRLAIDADDFHDGANKPKGFNRLVLGGRVRLRYAYVLRCDAVSERDADGRPVELQCTAELDTHAGTTHIGPARLSRELSLKCEPRTAFLVLLELSY